MLGVVSRSTFHAKPTAQRLTVARRLVLDDLGRRRLPLSRYAVIPWGGSVMIRSASISPGSQAGPSKVSWTVIDTRVGARFLALQVAARYTGRVRYT